MVGQATELRILGGIFGVSQDFWKTIGFLEIGRDFLRFW